MAKREKPSYGSGEIIDLGCRRLAIQLHKNGIPAKDIAETMGHAVVKMQFVYTVGMDANKRIAADRLGNELGGLENQLGKIGQFLPVASNHVN